MSSRIFISMMIQPSLTRIKDTKTITEEVMVKARIINRSRTISNIAMAMTIINLTTVPIKEEIMEETEEEVKKASFNKIKYLTITILINSLRSGRISLLTVVITEASITTAEISKYNIYFNLDRYP